MPQDDEAPESGSDSLRGVRAPRYSLLDPRAARGRLTLGMAFGALTTWLVPSSVPWNVRAMVGWDAGALLFATFAWVMIVRASSDETRRRAALEDPGRRIVFVIALASSVFSLFAAVGVLKQVRNAPPMHLQVWTGLALSAVVLSWIVTHTAFTLRYAHLYYRRSGTTHCLQFPGTKTPCDLDFAYFAFTIGMCYQVSDVVVASGRVRRAVLLHALVSFAYNTTILALALNLVTSAAG